ncbi:hypothetical protein Pth03_51390 [Planotetraspora thailandica]|uniref:Uncharacterized protein n=1 Tax=Planotetraspora thailandica TaxID=487172 RepID=A0A8J3XY09_9ACTN|nr:hypothetical protein Pth03_51390 [Planotetraspora thailandica]
MSLVTLAICTRLVDDFAVSALPVVASTTYARLAVIEGAAAAAAADVATGIDVEEESAAGGGAVSDAVAVSGGGAVSDGGAAAVAVPTKLVARKAAVSAPMSLIRIST